MSDYADAVALFIIGNYKELSLLDRIISEGSDATVKIKEVIIMKRTFVLIMVFVVVFASGCNRNGGQKDLISDKVAPNAILVVDDEQLCEESGLDHKNLIPDKPQHSVSEDVQINKSLVLNGLNHSLKYKDTLYYPIGAKRVHRYFVDGDENKAVLIDDKGAINSILYKYMTLNISRSSSPAAVLESLKPELSEITDISYYKNVKMPEPTHDAEGLGIYDYLFYNQNNGYMTDYLRVSVSDDGSVFGLSINNLTETNLNLNVNKEKEKNAIESKLKDIYNTDDTQFQSYAMSYDPCITVYENRIYIEYFISAEYTHKQHGEISDYIKTVLVPLSAVSD